MKKKGATAGFQTHTQKSDYFVTFFEIIIKTNNAVS